VTVCVQGPASVQGNMPRAGGTGYGQRVCALEL
jgi:hypothetical protein